MRNLYLYLPSLGILSTLIAQGGQGYFGICGYALGPYRQVIRAY